MTGPRRAKILYFATEDWFFRSHFLPMARAARDAGLEVVVAARVGDAAADIRAEGFRVVPLDLDRRSVNPLGALRLLARLVRLYRAERPDIVHHLALKPVLIGGIAARLAGVAAVVNEVTGLGYIFTSDDLRARALRVVMALLLPLALAGPRRQLLLENAADAEVLAELGRVPPECISIMPGAGVDIRHFRPLPEPAGGPVTIAVAARMVWSKGIGTLVEAHRILRRRGHDVDLLLAGRPDPGNPAAIAEDQLRAWAALPGVRWLGHCEDVRTLWARAHIAALPTRGGEGLPRALVEAAACGRPLVASDVPGCRDIVRPGFNGLLTPPGEPADLADALELLVLDRALRLSFGAAGRLLVERELSIDTVMAVPVGVYRKLLGHDEDPTSTQVTA